MIKLHNGKLSLTKTRALTPKQLSRYKTTFGIDRQHAYLLSCLGLSKSKIAISKLKSNGVNTLAVKPKHVVTALAIEARNNSNAMNHKPLKFGSWVGVELETIVPLNSIDCRHCDGNGSICDDENEESRTCDACDGQGKQQSDNIFRDIRTAITRANLTRISVRSDGSLSGNDDDNDGGPTEGVEVTCLFNTDSGYGTLAKVCSILSNDFNASVNKTCGMHVHFDFSRQGSDSAYLAGKRLGKCLPILALLVPESRRDNTYCKLGVSEFEGNSSERYHAVNMTAFNKHGSIEVRLHGGTLDALKIQRWIELLRTIMEMPNGATITTPEQLIEKIELGDDLKTFVLERYKKFNVTINQLTF